MKISCDLSIPAIHVSFLGGGFGFVQETVECPVVLLIDRDSQLIGLEIDLAPVLEDFPTKSPQDIATHCISEGGRLKKDDKSAFLSVALCPSKDIKSARRVNWDALLDLDQEGCIVSLQLILRSYPGLLPDIKLDLICPDTESERRGKEEI